MDRRHLGNVGEAQAIAELTKRGWSISVPLTEDNPYDLIAEREGNLYRVQVKATSNQRECGSYEVDLRTSSWNSQGQKRSKMNTEAFDFLFVWTGANCYLVPSEKVGGSRGIAVSPTNKYANFLL